MSNSTKRTNSKRRLKEWELNPFLFSFWQRLFHFERFEFLFPLIFPLLRLSGLFRVGFQQALAIRAHYLYLYFKDLPAAFDGYRLLFLSDLHADRNQAIMERLIQNLQNQQFDLVLLGGDYRFRIRGLFDRAMEPLQTLKNQVYSKDGWLAVLGNHDPFDMIAPLEQQGIHVLVNESKPLFRGKDTLWIVGLDEEHYFENADFTKATQSIPPNSFKIVVTHANDALLKMPAQACQLFLCGHTHGGQICFSGLGPLMVHSRLPRRLAAGVWKFNGITGFTTTGVGTSGLPVRFNCPGEFVIVTLKRSQ